MKLNKEWIHYFFDLCDTVARKSKDPSTKVGAVVIGPEKQVLGTAFNGFPMGVVDHLKRLGKPEKYDWTCHAEANIVALAARHGVRLEGATLFCNLQTCLECTKLLIQAGIKEIYCRFDEGTGEWREKIPKAIGMCQEAGVQVYAFDEFGKFHEGAGTGEHWATKCFPKEEK